MNYFGSDDDRRVPHTPEAGIYSEKATPVNILACGFTIYIIGMVAKL